MYIGLTNRVRTVVRIAHHLALELLSYRSSRDSPRCVNPFGTQRGFFYNATARTLSGYIGMIFRRDPMLLLPDKSAALHPVLKRFGNDVDLLGTTLDSYSKNVISAVISLGRAGTLVDWHGESEICVGEPIIELFFRLGIDLRRSNLSKRRNGFWRRFEGELDSLLADARAASVERIKLAHPDRGGGSEEAKSLSVAWNAIRGRFAKRGIKP